MQFKYIHIAFEPSILTNQLTGEIRNLVTVVRFEVYDVNGQDVLIRVEE